MLIKSLLVWSRATFLFLPQPRSQFPQFTPRLTIQPVVVGSGGDLLHFLLGSHRGPAAILLELDLVTVHAAVEDLHKKPADKQTHVWHKHNQGSLYKHTHTLVFCDVKTSACYTQLTTVPFYLLIVYFRSLHRLFIYVFTAEPTLSCSPFYTTNSIHSR